ncbi:MAG TPA: hypothetical protein VND99_04210 [Candidatus Acidoferrales bacterium]|nr:hypothetical protein [Candidatus Acidoferrales bacterium]
MARELKIRFSDFKTIEEKLKPLGADFIEEQSFIDTYFNQPPGHVLKLAKVNDTYFIQALFAIDGTFDVGEKQRINKEIVEEKGKELTQEFGVKKILKGTRKIFQLDMYKITFNHIDDVGDFLILTGANPTEEFFTERLGIKDPEYIRVSFDELSKQ